MSAKTLVLSVITAGIIVGCGSLAPVVPKDTRFPADPLTNAYMVNPVYTAVGETGKLIPAPYLPQALAVGTSVLALIAIYRNRRLAAKIRKQKDEVNAKQ